MARTPIEQSSRSPMRNGQSVLDDCYDTVWAIAASEFCTEFVIGLTKQRLRGRLYQYFGATKMRYQHLVSLADELNADQAKWLEAELQSAIWANGAAVPVLSKYRSDKKANRKSLGGVASSSDQYVYKVYMAWIEGPVSADNFPVAHGSS